MTDDLCAICQSPLSPGFGPCPSCGAAREPETARSLPVGSTLHHGQFAVGRVLGEGGFGITYKGAHRELRRPVAIKELFPVTMGAVRAGTRVSVPTAHRDAFRRAQDSALEEARIIAGLRSPHIVAVHDMFRENGTAYIVMEYLDGPTLEARLQETGTLSASEARHLTLNLCAALEEVHGHNLLHRDIKPANIVWLPDGRTVLIDFGSARLFDAGRTVQHTRILTVEYAAPEQYSPRARFGPYTDLFGLGATLYHAVTGVPPAGAVERLQGRDIAWPADLEPSLRTVLQRALALPVAERPQTAADFRRDLLETEAVSARNVDADCPLIESGSQMGGFIGIDLGITNSAICSYDGLDTRIWKSPEQNDVTPSALYIGQRGGRRAQYVGQRAYDSAPRSPGNVAQRFKRLMGTNTPVRFSALNLTLTPEECSKEILQTLFNYLPEEMRNDPQIGKIITVPVAFNQMKKDATMQAAELAGLGKVALVQESVAAVMCAAQSTNTAEGLFLVYDLGGDTFDVTVAEYMDGHVSLLATGSIEMCGGNDFDRALVRNVLLPWLRETFNVPDDVDARFMRLAHWATEKAKIALSAQPDALIQMDETEIDLRDLDGEEIFFECPLSRADYERVIAEKINDTIKAVQETLDKSGFANEDMEHIVFIGGPTHYKPLRDKVASALGLIDSTGANDINPMTAVAEGASIFAATVDWSTASTDFIPASHSISIETLERIGSTKTRPVYLVEEGMPLPAKGMHRFKAYKALKAGTEDALTFKLWEGPIKDPVSDNRCIGVMKIAGRDLEDGVIAVGDDLVCEYEVLDSGQISLHVSIPSIDARFSEKNFYSREEGQRDYTSAAGLAQIKQEADETLHRVRTLAQSVSDPRLGRIQQKLAVASGLTPDEPDADSAQEAHEYVLESRRVLGQVRKEHREAIRCSELDDLMSRFNRHLREVASTPEIQTFENLSKTAQRAIERQDHDVERFLEELKSNEFGILWRQPGFLIAIFQNMLAASPHLYLDPGCFQHLAATGERLIQDHDFEGFQQVLMQLAALRIDFASGTHNIPAMVNEEADPIRHLSDFLFDKSRSDLFRQLNSALRDTFSGGGSYCRYGVARDAVKADEIERQPRYYRGY